MYGAQAAFAAESAKWLRGLRPSVLSFLTPPTALSVDVVVHRPVPTRRRRRRQPTHPSLFSPRVYNPSVVAAPPDLCESCAYVVALRADEMDQCLAGVSFGRFSGTVLALLDANLTNLGWTWLLNEPENQILSTLNATRAASLGKVALCVRVLQTHILY